MIRYTSSHVAKERFYCLLREVYFMKLVAVSYYEMIKSDIFEKALVKLFKSRKGLNKHNENTKRSLMSEIIVRYLIKKFLKEDRPILKKNIFGKPLLENYPNFYFNISHSGKWIVCAIDDQPIGIDIQQIVVFDFKFVVEFFSIKEIKSISERQKEQQLNYFYDLWTLKESYVKAKGIGLNLPLHLFSIMICKDGIKKELLRGDENMFLKQYYIDHHYSLSVCASTNKFPKNFKFLKISQLSDYLDRI